MSINTPLLKYIKYLSGLRNIDNIIISKSNQTSILKEIKSIGMDYSLFDENIFKKLSSSDINKTIVRQIAKANLLFIDPYQIGMLELDDLDTILDKTLSINPDIIVVVQSIYKDRPLIKAAISKISNIPSKTKYIIRKKHSLTKVENIFDSYKYSSYFIKSTIDNPTIFSAKHNRYPFEININESLVVGKVKYFLSKLLFSIFSDCNDWCHSKLYLVSKDSYKNSQLDFEYAKITGRVFSVIYSYNYVLRIDNGAGGAIKEHDILIRLSKSDIGKHIIVPISTDFRDGAIIKYPYIENTRIDKVYSAKMKEFVVNFLYTLSLEKNLDRINLSYGYTRLESYIKKNSSLTTAYKNTLVNYIKSLESMDTFRYLTHGEFRFDNMLKNSKSFYIIDWPQAYIGHPLIDYWMFLYWDGVRDLKNNIGECPSTLVLNLDQDSIKMLWLIWRGAYNR